MKILIFILITATSISCCASEAGDWKAAYDKEKQEAAVFISKLPDYACFTQVYEVTAKLPWEIAGPRQDGVYMVIKKVSTGFLMAQKVPECEKRISCGYWIRSWTYSDNVFTHGLTRIPCPTVLTKQFIKNLIKKEYYDEIRYTD